ncbi:flagellin lysine-N-methylase [Cetobacterium sp.]|uniref:flagellin lysine-N-methylase n=1 Tax=Cetobacterium sp. TaxID=2071632 RepID=UPI003F3F0375
MEIRDYEYILIPNILEKYKCSMSGECCQSKWRIDIDEQSYLETKKNLENQKEDINTYMEKHESGSYVSKFSNGYCKFITEDKKCRVHKDFGWECLSDTCKIYPRNLKLTSRGMEIGMGFSCRSSAKLLLSKEKFYIKKIKKEDYFFMKPRSVSFIIPENNLKKEIASRYYELEQMAIDILNLDEKLDIKLKYLEKIISELYTVNIEEYDFKKNVENFKELALNLSDNSENLEDEIVKIILEKQKRSKSVGLYYINLLRIIRLNKNLELDKKILGSDSFTLTSEELKELKEVWNKEYDRILQNYFLCLIFNKEMYYNAEYFMMKATMLTIFLKFRILLNIKYLGRELTEEELIYTIKSHDEDLAHDSEFFSEFYKTKCEEKVNISDLIKKLLTLIS